MKYEPDKFDVIIERGRKLNAVIEQMERLKKSSQNDEVRALAAALQTVVEVIRPLVLFNA